MTNEERLQKIADLIDSSREQLGQIDKLANEFFEEVNDYKESMLNGELDIEYPLYLLLQPLNDTIRRMDNVSKNI